MGQRSDSLPHILIGGVMLDPIRRAEWFNWFLQAALKFPDARRNRQRTETWARAMSMIAEQFDPPPPRPRTRLDKSSKYDS